MPLFLRAALASLVGMLIVVAWFLWPGGPGHAPGGTFAAIASACGLFLVARGLALLVHASRRPRLLTHALLVFSAATFVAFAVGIAIGPAKLPPPAAVLRSELGAAALDGLACAVAAVVAWFIAGWPAAASPATTPGTEGT